MSQLSHEEAELISQENRFLKQTIFNLRNELEKCTNDQISLIQSKTLQFSGEQKSLKEIIEKQREQIESISLIAEEEKQVIKSLNDREIKQLHEIIKNLRLEIDFNLNKSQDSIQKAIGRENQMNQALKKSLIEVRAALDVSESEKLEIEQNLNIPETVFLETLLPKHRLAH